MDYRGQNPHYTKSLIYIVKTATAKSHMDNNYRTPSARSYLDNDGWTPTIGSDVDKKVGGDLQIANGTIVIRSVK